MGRMENKKAQVQSMNQQTLDKNKSRWWIWFIVVLILIVVGGTFAYWLLSTSQVEFPNELGDYILENKELGTYACAPANQFGPSLGIPIEDEICIEGFSFEYLNKEDDLSEQRGIRLTLAEFSKGKDVYKNTVIPHLRPIQTSNIYRSGEPWELYWWSGDNYISLQVFVKQPTDTGHTNRYPNTANVEHPVITWFLDQYPPTE